MAQKKDSAAIEQFQSAAKLESNARRKSWIYHNIGVICQGHQMFGEAIEAYKEALRNNPNDDETRYNLELCKRQQQQQNQDKQNQQQNKDKDKQDQQKQQEKQQQQQKPQMSKENAEQLLNAAMQEEKNTQERIKKAQHQKQTRKLQKNW